MWVWAIVWFCGNCWSLLLDINSAIWIGSFHIIPAFRKFFLQFQSGSSVNSSPGEPWRAQGREECLGTIASHLSSNVAREIPEKWRFRWENHRSQWWISKFPVDFPCLIPKCPDGFQCPGETVWGPCRSLHSSLSPKLQSQLRLPVPWRKHLGEICRKVQGKPCFCDGKRPGFTMVFFSQRPQKMFEDVWITMDHITIYYRSDQWGRREHTFIVGMVLHHS